MSYKRRLTKSKKSQIEKETEYLLNTKFGMRQIEPVTKTQSKLFESYGNDKNILAIGTAGTGKTYISLYLALKDVMAKTSYKEIIIIRSAVQARQQGFMPGNEKEKMSHFESPYVDIVNDLFERGDAYQVMKQKSMIRFMSTSFLRGITFDNAIIVVDEVQNMSDAELHTIMTRVGENSKIIFCGDIKQDDLTSERYNEKSGLVDFMRVINNMDEFESVEFCVDDIVRSKLVKSYILERERLGL